jgi:endoglucanase
MRRFLVLLGLVIGMVSAFAGPPRTVPYPRPLPEPSAAKLPRWRGFKLLYFFNARCAPTPPAVMEEDFRLIASLGFNFARIPMDYRCWITGDGWEKIDEARLADIDRVVALGEKYGVHVSLNFHRAPGYTVAKPAESRSLWKDA